ncbi:MAG: CPXCG motif-containing cysteine-rich protein [Planctomycetota bacterium]
MRILFLHGWRSIVGGVKPTFLISSGHHVLNPSLDDDDFESAVATAQRIFDQQKPDVIVGSSRGGAVAMNLMSNDVPMVLLCPAWKRWGNADSIKSQSYVLHSRNDEVIPFEHSEELIAASRLSSDRLLEVGYDHRLADDGSLSVMLWACKMLVSPESKELFEYDEAPVSSRRQASAISEASYICDACGEEIVVPLDLSEGCSQSYVEDCPVCCRASVIHVHVDENGRPMVWAEPEQDRV